MLENEPTAKIESEVNDSGGFQFSTRWLMKLTVAASVLFAAAVNFGPVSLVVILPIAFIGFLVQKKQYDFAISTFVLFMMAPCLLPFDLGSRTSTRRSMCSNNLRQLEIALLNYESAHGHLPPAFTTDAAGNKLHSWRVLILPFMEGNAIYKQLDLTKPWNHPVNAKFANQAPDCFRCPSNKKLKPDQTSYLAVVGANTYWRFDGTPVKLSEVTDGTSNTISLIDAPIAVNWMEPVDINFNGITKNKAGSSDLISSPHTGGTNMAFGDGSVRFIPSDLTYETFIGLLTINGGEVIKDDFMP